MRQLETGGDCEVPAAFCWDRGERFQRQDAYQFTPFVKCKKPFNGLWCECSVVQFNKVVWDALIGKEQLRV